MMSASIPEKWPDMKKIHKSISSIEFGTIGEAVHTSEGDKEIAKKKIDDFADYFKTVLKNSAPTDKNISRHFSDASDKPLADLIKVLAKKYKVGMDGTSIVAPIKGGSIEVHMAKGGTYFTTVDDFESGGGRSNKLKSDKDVITVFKKLA